MTYPYLLPPTPTPTPNPNPNPSPNPNPTYSVLDWKLPLSTYQPPRFTAAKHAAAAAVAAEVAAAREVDWGARCSWAGPIELFDGALG